MSTPDLPPADAGTSHLAFALRLLPAERRRDTLVFHRFCRAVDDIADEPGMDRAARRGLLMEWRRAVLEDRQPELAPVLERHGIDHALPTALVDGCLADVEGWRPSTMDDLEQYCWRVACSVGLASIRIFGCADARSETYATHLGHALQLVNILRDIAEDAATGRVYLPLEELETVGLDAGAVENRPDDPRLQPVLRKLAALARARFAAAIEPPRDFKPLLPARVMKAVYEEILSRIERDGFRVTGPRISLPPATKLAIALRAVLARRPRGHAPTSHAAPRRQGGG
jgi:15-cis-phytoene synthase